MSKPLHTIHRRRAIAPQSATISFLKTQGWRMLLNLASYTCRGKGQMVIGETQVFYMKPRTHPLHIIRKKGELKDLFPLFLIMILQLLLIFFSFSSRMPQLTANLDAQKCQHSMQQPFHFALPWCSGHSLGDTFKLSLGNK